jgi:hypothetical protein
MCQPAPHTCPEVNYFEANPLSFSPNFLAYHAFNTVTLGFESFRYVKQDCRLSNAWSTSYEEQPLHAHSFCFVFIGNGF